MLKIIFLITIFLSFNTYSDVNKIQENNEKSPRFAIHLLDYLAHDYGGAVEHGKVISTFEYDEQKEFVNKVYELAGSLPELKNEKTTYNKIIKLKSMIEAKAEAIDVALQARDIQKDLITITKITLSPTNAPSISNGKLLFQQNCISCHGQNGFGDGADGKAMDPLPSNFHEPVRMSAISAFHSFNTIRLGVPGTGMASFSQFSDKEVWDLAFYVMAIRQFDTLKTAPSKEAVKTDNITLEELATLSDTELKAKISAKTNTEDENSKNIALALLRTKDTNTSGGDYIGKSKSYLNEALEAFKNNSKDDAKRLSIQAYLEGI
ncbi:MAG: cytochrome c, partial [Alphaproteobacteria bacterium]